MDVVNSSLLTDLYELNMAQAYLGHGKTGTAVFEFFVRSGYALHTCGPRGSDFSGLTSSRLTMRRYGTGSTATACWARR